MKKIILIALSFVFQTNFAQLKHSLGKVTVDQLQEVKHPTDSAAAAAIVFKTGLTKFAYVGNKWEISTIVKYKIKIYKKEGLSLADYSIPYYTSSSGSEIVKFSNAYTYNLVDGAVEKTKVKSENQFKEESSANWMQKKISFPNVKVGSIIEFSYEYLSPYITNFNEFKFQSKYPTDYVEYTTYIPSYFTYRTFITGYEKIETALEDINGIEYGEKKIVYSKFDMPAIVEEDFVDNIDNYTSVLKLELASVQYPNTVTENYSLDWEGVTKKIYEDENFGNEVNKTGYFNDDLDILLKNTLDQKDKINTILGFVKAKVKWNSKHGIYCKDGVRKAYKDGIGNVAEINLMLVAMLRYAGIEANPILLSTRENGLAIFPSRTAFDYVICGVENNKEIILLDATDKNTVPNVIPERAINWVGRMIRKNNTSEEVDLKQQEISNNSYNAIFSINPAAGSISGKIREQFSHFSAYSFRNKYGGINKESYIENLEKRRNNIEINNLEVLNIENLDKPIVQSFDFNIENGAEIIGNKLFFSPMLFYATKENPFKQEKRKFPVNFVYPFLDKYIVNVDIPDGYEIESLPSQSFLTLENNLVRLKYLINTADKKIQISYRLEINSSLISFDYYEDLKAIFNEMIKKENEKIVLKKV
ncbi:MAG: hypothetical protein ACJAQ1_001237 [Flavobacterium sp.]|jgi:hypothetical protein